MGIEWFDAAHHRLHDPVLTMDVPLRGRCYLICALAKAIAATELERWH